jgi:pimeloyl-ACP methyl ester carboxylesterase
VRAFAATLALAALALLSAGAAVASAGPYKPEPLGQYAPLNRPGPKLSPPVSAMADAMQCSGDLVDATVTPVLLVPGTGASAMSNFGFGYEPALTDLGIPWCAITFPADGNNYLPTNGEYMVYAIRTMYAWAGRRIDIIGHSQGGMIPRWALRFWPDTRHMVDDQIGFAPPNQGTTAASPSCPHGCQISTTEQAAGSMFIQALDSGAETFPGISYTEVFSHDDEEVHPNQDDGDSATDLFGGGGMITNVSVQDVCPADVVEHLGIGTFDPVAYALAINAMSHPGPAIPAEIPKTVCNEKLMPGIDPLTFGPAAAEAAVQTETSAALTVYKEPPLPCYVYATGCPKASKAKATSKSITGCTRIRNLTLPLYTLKGTRIVAVTAYVGKRRVLHRTGRNLRRVSLAHLPASGTHTIRIVTRSNTRTVRVTRRRYIAC